MEVFAGLRVRDYAGAREWYDRLLGEPSFLPHDSEAVWTLSEGGSVYVVEEPEHAGHSVVTLFVEDLDGRVAEIAGRGIEPADCETYSNGVRKANYRDADGNLISFGGPPAEGA